MRFVFFVYHDEVKWAGLPAAERDSVVQEYVAFYKEVEKRGVREANATLQPSMNAITVRNHDNAMHADSGAYHAGAEQMGGVYIVDCQDMDEALELAKLNPATRYGGVEIRPIVDNQRILS